MPLRRTLAVLALPIALGVTLLAQTATPAPATPMTPSATAQPEPGATATLGAVRGRATDPDHAVVPGVTVTVTDAAGHTRSTQTTGDGSYLIPKLAPGAYTVHATLKGFGDLDLPAVTVTAAVAAKANLHMVPTVNTTITVTTTGPQLNVSSDNNASTLVLTGKDLDALSDDPDELSDELNALAGPAAGPNGGQIYIDGFTGGTLPPKSSIREIRINQNPFSAQYDRIGYGRIEVFTKPGTDTFHGQFSSMGNSDVLNTSALVGGTYQPPYHTLFFMGSLTGPLSKSSSFNLGGNFRQIQDNNVVNTTILNSAYIPTSLIQAVFYPQTRFELTPRFDLQLTPTNTLTVRYQVEHNAQTNAGTGNNSLATAGYNYSETDNEIQIRDAQVIGNRFVSETRFEYEHDASTTTALNPQLTTNVSGAFTDFGNGVSAGTDAEGHWEVQSYNSAQLTNNFLRFGGRLRVNSDSNTNSAGTFGQFTYGGLTNVTFSNALAALLPTSCQPSVSIGSAIPLSGICNYSATLKNNGPSTSIGIGPTQFAASYGNTAVSASEYDLGLYAEDEWKMRPNITLTVGLRYETQNHISDHHDFAPRIALAWGILPKNGAPTFVLRGGFGIFYDRFSLGNYESIVRYNGASTSEQQITVTPTTGQVLNFNACSAIPGCATTAGYTVASSQSIYSSTPNLRSPFTIQYGGSIEHQMTKSWTATATYLHSYGQHQFYSQNLAAVTGSGPKIFQYVSEGVFKQNQLIVQSNYRGPAGTSLFGYYTLSYANADTNGSGYFPSIPNQITADYGRAAFDIRQRLFFGGTVMLPHLISINPFLIANSGAPFNVTLGEDLNGDSIYNDRPAFATSAILPQNLVVSPYGSFDRGTTLNQARIPINYAQGPAAASLNIRIQKAIGIGPRLGGKTTQQSSGGPGGPGGPPPGAPGGGGHHEHGGMGPGGMGGSSNTGRKYSLSLGAQALNVFNVVNYAPPVGNLSSPQFGHQTRLAGPIFTTNSAVRRIMLQANFTF